MALTLGAMERTIIRILSTDPAIRFLNFRLKGPGTLSVPISTNSYYAVARRMQTEKSEGVPSLRCVYVPDYNRQGISEYNPDSDIFFSGSRDFATAAWKGLLIHECTHAVNDLHRVHDLPRVDDEASAYIAQAVYLLKHGIDTRTYTELYHQEAGKLAQRIVRRGEYNITVDDREALTDAIMGDNLYNSKSLEEQTLDGIDDGSSYRHSLAAARHPTTRPRP